MNLQKHYIWMPSLAVILSFISSPILQAQNPFVAVPNAATSAEQWQGSEWGDHIDAPTEDGIPFAAKVEVRRLAQMSWGQIVRYRFVSKGERQIPPLYFLVRDQVILELVEADMEFLIGAIAVMRTPPKYENTDVRGQSKAGTLKSSDGSWTNMVTTAGDTSTFSSSHPSGHSIKLVWQKGKGLIEYLSNAGALKDGFHIALGGTGKIVGTGFDLTAEKIGELKLGLSADKAAKLLPVAPGKGENVFQAANGSWSQEWSWKPLGVVIDMASDKEDGPKQVEAITVEAPSNLKTTKGIGIGDTAAAVESAYAGSKSKPDSSATRFVAGSLFGGLIFHFEDEKVTKMFLGAASE